MMLIMLDDVQLADEKVFFPFMSNCLGCGNDGITDLDKLYDVLSEYDDEIEIIVHDLNDVPDEDKGDAKKLIAILMDARLTNRKLKITFNND